MKPIKVNQKFRSNMWNPEHKVWYQHNEDKESTAHLIKRVKSKISKSVNKYARSKGYPRGYKQMEEEGEFTA